MLYNTAMQNRLDHLRNMMQSAGVGGFLISASCNIFYLSGFNRFLVDHDGFLLVTRSNMYVITSPLYTHAVKKFSPDLAILETSPDAWYAQLVKKIATKEKIQLIGFEERDLRVGEYFDLKEEKIELKSVSLRNLRIQKDEKEIAAVQKACKTTDTVFEKILPYLKEHVTELAIAGIMDTLTKELGAEIGFPSIVAFGQHSAVPHHMTSDEKLQKNSFVLFDFGLKYDSYLSDMSRTVFFGKPTTQQVKLYETVKKAQEKAIAYIQHAPDDVFVKDIDRIARETIEKENFTPYPHALGHGLGLEVHEAPTLSVYSPEKLIDNVVFTIEPGIYQPDMGGVRIEDVFVKQQNIVKQLTNAPKDLIVLS